MIETSPRPDGISPCKNFIDLTDDERNQVLELLKRRNDGEYITLKQIARITNVGEHRLRHFIRHKSGVNLRIIHKHQINNYNTNDKNDVNPIEKQKQKAQEDVLRKEHVSAVKELAFRDFISDMFKDVVNGIDPPPPYNPVTINDTTTEEVFLLHLSDFHASEIIKPQNTFGLNEYDQEITERRALTIVNKTIEIKRRLERGGYSFPRLVIAANGDFVSGTIHEAERHTNGTNVMTTALWCGSLLARMIRDLSADFKDVHVFCTSGNHGRLADAKKVQLKDPTRNWDYLIYRYAEALLQSCPNIKFIIPNAWGVVYEICNSLFCQSHGHFIKSWNGLPFYSMSRLTTKLNAVLSRRYNQGVDYWIMGHFHTQASVETSGGEYLVNPCLVGPQELGIYAMGEATPPGQMLYGVHPKHGITHRWRLHAESEWPQPNLVLDVPSVQV